jgi:hypothetical protein
MERAQDLAERWLKLDTSKQHEFVRNALKRVTVGRTTAWIEIDRSRLLATLLQQPEAARSGCAHRLGTLRLVGEFQILRGKRQIHLVPRSSEPDGTPAPSIVKAVARACNWYERIVKGEIESIDELMQQSGLTRSYIMRIIPCACLAPQIVDAVLEGKHRPDLTLNEFLRRVPIDWREQKKRFSNSSL